MDHSLTEDELLRLLAREKIGVIASVNPDGSPHAVPIWLVLIGESVYVETSPGSRKAKNLKARPQFAFTLGFDVLGASAMLKGTAVEVTDEETREEVSRRVAVRYYGTEAHPGFRTLDGLYEAMGGRIVFRLDVEKVVSWDYDKLPAESWLQPHPFPSR